MTVQHIPMNMVYLTRIGDGNPKPSDWFHKKNPEEDGQTQPQTSLPVLGCCEEFLGFLQLQYDLLVCIELHHSDQILLNFVNC